MEKTTIVLIHGAGLGAWIWDRVAPELGQPVLAVDLPMRGGASAALARLSFEDYARAVAGAVESSGAGRVVLVGHSIGGEIALRAAVLLPGRVAGIALVSAVIPPPGKSMISLQHRLRRWFMRLALRYGPPKPPDAVIRASVCNGLEEADCRLVLEKYGFESPRLFLDPVEWKLESLPPRLYVKTLEDLSVLPPLQDLMIARVQPVRVETLESGHLPMLARPEELAKILKNFIHSLPSV